MAMKPCCDSVPYGWWPSYRRFIIAMGLACVVFWVSCLPHMMTLHHSFTTYFALLWGPVVVGLVLGGVMDYGVPDGFILRYLGQRRKRSIAYALVAGITMSSCSHGMAAIGMQLYKKGASIPAVMTFLMAGPWFTIPIFLLLYGFFGLHAIILIMAALVIALVIGWAYMGLLKVGWVDDQHASVVLKPYQWDCLKERSVVVIARGVGKGIVDLANRVVWWVILGFLIAVFINAYLPHHLITTYLGGGSGGLLRTLLVATVIEVCSEGSSPIAFEIFKQVGTLGPSFVFLMAGVATDYTEIGLIWTCIGKKPAIWLPIVSVPVVLLGGFLLNLL